MTKKIGIISQARMTSSRLPGKVLREVKNKTLLDYHVERLNDAGEEICIATTTNFTDDSIVEFCESRGIKFYRGSENDVLSRYYEAARVHGYDIIVRVTSDCPLIDGVVVREGINAYLEKNHGQYYISNSIERTFARGFDFEIFSFESLERSFFEAKTIEEREHVTPYIRNKIPEMQFISILNRENNSNFRVTVDELDDFNLIKALIEYYDANLLSAHEIEKILQAHPELVRLNSHIEQKKI